MARPVSDAETHVQTFELMPVLWTFLTDLVWVPCLDNKDLSDSSEVWVSSHEQMGKQECFQKLELMILVPESRVKHFRVCTTLKTQPISVLSYLNGTYELTFDQGVH